MVNTIKHCPECNAAWRDGQTCREHYDQMLAWELEDPTGAGAVHHLTVLSYNLQHPSIYSPEALLWAKNTLRKFLVEGITPQMLRKQNRQLLDSGKRTFKITGTPEAYGEYDFPVQWTMHVGEVAAGGLDGYCERVEAWSRSIYAALMDSGNLPD